MELRLPLELESVICTAEMWQRPARTPDYEAESRALVALSCAAAHSPESVLHKLAETALEICSAGSAGISLVEDDNGQKIFRWRAIAGLYAPNLLGTTPRDFSPCGTVIDRNAVQLFSRPSRVFRYLDQASPTIVEALLVPFAVESRPVGTIWVLSHDERKKFDSEDARVMGSLAKAASGAYQTLQSLKAVEDTDRKKDEFLAILSHELRSPVNTVVAWSHVLRTGDVDESTRERGLAAIQRSAKQQARMVNDLLDSARIMSGKLSLELQDAELALIVRTSVDAARDDADEKEIALECVVEPSRIAMRADPIRLQQVVANLVRNAIKFTPTGGRVRVEARCVEGEAEICVSDTGIGISPEFLSHVFERFRQEETFTTSKPHEGLGLGLAIARHIVELHGGTIEAESDGVGRGSNFRVRLPVQALSAGSVQDAAAKAQADLSGIAVLVVEDDTDTRLALEIILRDAGSRVQTASTVREALHAVADERPDVVLTDLGMSGEDGYALQKALQRLYVDWRHSVPVIALTGSAMPDDRLRVRDAGFALHLTKPVAPADLLKAIAMAASGAGHEFAQQPLWNQAKESR